MILFIASDAPLLLVPWDEKKPGFNVEPLRPAEQAVRQHFSMSSVVCAGAHTCCGCGFSYGLLPAESPESEGAAGRASVAALREYLRKAAQAGPLEIYSCWSGDEGQPPESRVSITLDHFGGERFQLQERQLLLLPRSG